MTDSVTNPVTNFKKELLKKIKNREAVIAVYGLGYVGLPLALRFAEAGFTTLGFDTDRDKVKKLNAGKSYIERIRDREIAAAVADGFTATGDYALTATAHALIICVPTPLGKHNEPDLGYVIDTMEGIAPHLKQDPQQGRVVSLESTTYPGTTEEELLPRITARGLTVGEDIFLVYSPEREDPGNPDFNTRTIPKVCGGHTANCLEVGAALYGEVIDQVVQVSSTRAAEMTKLLENIYRAVNIGLVNELKLVADKMDIDLYEVIDAAATKPFGYTPFYPGPGTGGHCLPIDPFYLVMEGERIRREFKIHRTRRRGQRRHASVVCGKSGQPAQPVGQIGFEGAGPRPRRVLQKKRGRHARITGVENHRPADEKRRKRVLRRPACTAHWEIAGLRVRLKKRNAVGGVVGAQ